MEKEKETTQNTEKTQTTEKTENRHGFSMSAGTRASQQGALRALREHLVDACVSLARVGF